MNKAKTMKWLTKNDFNCPKTITVSTVADLKKINFLPAVIKPSVGSGGSSNIFIVQKRDDLIAFCKYFLSISPKFIVQQYIGTPDSEYTVGILNDMSGNFLNSIAVKRMILSGLSNRIKVSNITKKSKK